MIRPPRSFALSCLVLLVAVAGLAYACAWIDEEDLSFTFFAPESMRSDAYEPFFRSFHALYIGWWKESNVDDFRAVNVREWRAYLGGAVSDSIVAHVLYDVPRTVISAYADGRDPRTVAKIPEDVHRFFAAIDPAPRRRAAAGYLDLARRCEPFVTYGRPWWSYPPDTASDPRRDSTSLDALLGEADRRLDAADDGFLRDRLHFQIVRLLFHRKRYAACVDRYRAWATAFMPDGTMRDRTLCYAAGALVKLRRFDEANYLYALAYDRTPELRTTAELSFHPMEEGDWKRTLAMSRTPRERAVLWQLFGIYADPLRAMYEIRAIDPASDLLDLLLVRAVNIAEESFLPERWHTAESAPVGYALRKARVDPGFVSFVTSVADSGGTNDPALWDLAAGYLLVARGEFDRAPRYLARARAAAYGDTVVDRQARIVDLVRRVETYVPRDRAEEESFAADLAWLDGGAHGPEMRASQALDWCRKRLAEKYRALGDSVHAQLLDPESDLQYYRDPHRLVRMLAFLDSGSLGAFDRYLRDAYRFHPSDIVAYEAVRPLYEGRFDSAAALFERRPGSGDAPLLGDPFVIHIRDCHDCDHAVKGSRTWTKLTFVRKMRDLRARIADAPRDAQARFLFANGLYNMTFYGNARLVYANPLYDNGYLDPGMEGDAKGHPIFDCSAAERWYLAALRASGNPEFRAKCCFMAAKCEQNAFFNTKPADYPGDFRAGKYFERLRAEFASTRYYREIVRECGYFRTYLDAFRNRR